MLREADFSLNRTVRHGEFWTDPHGSKILLARELAGRNLQNFLSELKRAIKSRPSQITVIKPGTPILLTEPAESAPSLEPTEPEQLNPLPLKEPIMKKTLSPKSKADRRTQGKQIILKLQAGEFPLLSHDEVYSLLIALEYKNCWLKLDQFIKSTTTIKDESGTTFFESKEILPFIQERMEKKTHAANVTKQKTKPKLQTPRAIILPPFALSLYEQVAAAEGKSVEEIFARILTSRAKLELETLAKNFSV